MLAEIQGVVLDLVEMGEQVVKAQAAVRHQVVEALHQLGLGEDGEVRDLHRAAARQALAPERRVLRGVSEQLVQALLLEELQPLARPALTLGQLLAQSTPARHVLQALDPVAHRVLLRP